MTEEQSTAYVQVHIDQESGKPSHFLVNRIPFTEYRLHPGQPIPVDKLYQSYEQLKLGLTSEFKIRPHEVPPKDYFNPTLEELEYEEDPILRVVPPEEEEMTWERDARKAVQRALEDATWDYENKTVTLYDRDDPRIRQTIHSFEDLQNELETIADIGSQNSMPWEGGPVFSIDAEGIVTSELEDYDDNIRNLGWGEYETPEED